MSTISLEIGDNFLDALVEKVQERLDPECRYVSKEKLCELLGIRPRTIETWRSHGLPGIRVGKTIMYSVPDVTRWIESH